MSKHIEVQAVYRIVSQQRDNTLTIEMSHHPHPRVFQIKVEELIAHPNLLSGFDRQDMGIIKHIAEEEAKAYH